MAITVGDPFADDAGEQDVAATGATEQDAARDSTQPARTKVWRGNGPPPGAHGPKGDDKAWQRAWKKLTPQQRERTMARLAEEHAVGVRAWAKCKAEGREGCEKPMPPGLAKKQLRG